MGSDRNENLYRTAMQRCGLPEKFIRQALKEANKLRQSIAPSIDEVIERYYRSRAHGGRVTLRQLAQETGISYSTLTKRKMGYDHAGKWGSKK